MTRVLVVDDSALMRKYLRQILEKGGFEVATARNGADALAQIDFVDPDVVTLDVNMPEMDGLTCLGKIMSDSPRPVVMVSSLTDRGALVTLEAMELGAVDYLLKPGGTISMNIMEVERQLLVKVGVASRARVDRRPGRPGQARRRTERRAGHSGVAIRSRFAKGQLRLVLIGTSTGGPAALPVVLTELPASFPAPIVVAQHIPASFTGHLAARLDGLCKLNVEEVTMSVELHPGSVYIGQGDADVVVSARGSALYARPAPADPNRTWHPSVDRLVESARAAVRDSQILGVLLTGMGDDGAASMAEVRRGGGYTVAESEQSAIVWGMPGELVHRGGADVVLDIDDIGQHLTNLI